MRTVGACDRAGLLIHNSMHWLCILACQRGRQVAIGVDLLLQVLHLLLGDADRIGAGDEAARRGLLAGNREKCLRELGWVASLLSVLGCPPFLLSSIALDVVRDGWLSVKCRPLCKEFSAEEAGIDDGGADAERRDLGLERLHPALQAELSSGVGGIELEARKARTRRD